MCAIHLYLFHYLIIIADLMIFKFASNFLPLCVHLIQGVNAWLVTLPEKGRNICILEGKFSHLCSLLFPPPGAVQNREVLCKFLTVLQMMQTSHYSLTSSQFSRLTQCMHCCTDYGILSISAKNDNNYDFLL